MHYRFATLVAAFPLAFAAPLSVAADAASAPGVAASAPLASGIDPAGQDPAVRPQDDLFRAMNGVWLAKTDIPADKAEFGPFNVLADQSDQHVRTIVETIAAQPQPAGSTAAKLRDFYASYMDTDAIDRAGLAPLAPFMARIAAVRTPRQVAQLMGRWQSVVGTPIELSVETDEKDPTIYSAQAAQSGLGMDDRDYYLKADARFAKAREAYAVYVARLLALDGDKAASAHAAAVIALEKRLAQVQWPSEDNRDASKTYNPTTIPELAKTAPGFDWQAFVEAGDMGQAPFFSISQPSYAVAFAKLFRSEPLETWKLYLRVRLLDALATELPAGFRDARFQFRSVALTGVREDRPRWQKAVRMLDVAMGEAVGQAYVGQYFPPAYKARMVQLVDNLLATYSKSIDTLTWMTPATKAAAHEKLAKYGIKIGYPDRWRDYSALEIKTGDPVGNDTRSSRFEYLRQAVRIGKPVDRSEWAMTPQTVNAYYDPSQNEIVFPAAILQPPLFDMRSDDAANYGAIGAIIGHEISHGFDDQGSKFDGDGKLRDWWTAEDNKAFQAITARLVAQFDGYEALPGVHVNGQLTLGENIADLSGLQIAYKAYELSLDGQPSPVIDGLTGEQRFYESWGQSWREKMRDERTLQLNTIDPHSPSAFRADGAAINSDGYHAAFGTQPGDRMYKAPADRIRLW